MLMHWACVKLVLPKKGETCPFSSQYYLVGKFSGLIVMLLIMIMLDVTFRSWLFARTSWSFNLCLWWTHCNTYCCILQNSVVLWQKSHLSYLSYFKTKTRSQYEKKNAVYYFQISLFVPEIFKFFKYANKINQVMRSYKTNWKADQMAEKDKFMPNISVRQG